MPLDVPPTRSQFRMIEWDRHRHPVPQQGKTARHDPEATTINQPWLDLAGHSGLRLIPSWPAEAGHPRLFELRQRTTRISGPGRPSSDMTRWVALTETWYKHLARTLRLS